jgi:hypothetical protein
MNPRGRLLMFRGAQLAALSALALLSACAVQERVYVPPPRVYAPPPPPPPAVEVDAGGGGVEITATEAPPPLPDYEQPPCPEDGYLWTPGYWHFGPAGYYWVPGTWVQPPSVGVLWTPGYWGFAGGVYGFHAGYWGPHIGFYGGVNYGFGYVGVGYAGGRWEGGHFAYNTAVVNVNVSVIHNTYNQTVINNNVTVNRVSFNGGAGIHAVPTPQERSYSQEAHIPPTSAQVQHVQTASSNPALSVRANGGHPAIAATAKAGAFSGPGVVGAHGATPLKPGAPNNFGGAAGAAGMHGGTTPPSGQGNGAHPPVAGQPNAFHPPAGNAPAGNAPGTVRPPQNGAFKAPVSNVKPATPAPKAPPPKAPPPKKPGTPEKERP